METVFVTVGSTSFDHLITISNQPEFHAALWRLGYRKLVVQYGAGSVVPCSPSISAVRKATENMGYSADASQPLLLDHFRFKKDISGDIAVSSLIVSHGGAGTCLQSLRSPGFRRLIVVINTTLSENHQEDLAFALAKGKNALLSEPGSLVPLLWHGVLDCPFPSEIPWNDYPSDVIRFLGPSTPPDQVGFVKFPPGQPERLSSFLDRRFRISAQHRVLSINWSLSHLPILVLSSVLLPTWIFATKASINCNFSLIHDLRTCVSTKSLILRKSLANYAVPENYLTSAHGTVVFCHLGTHEEYAPRRSDDELKCMNFVHHLRDTYGNLFNSSTNLVAITWATVNIFDVDVPAEPTLTTSLEVTWRLLFLSLWHVTFESSVCFILLDWVASMSQWWMSCAPFGYIF